MTLGERIKLIRGDVSREKFSPMTGISKTTLVNYETGASSPTAEYLNKLLTMFPNINPAWLLAGEGEMYRGDVANIDDIWAGDLTFREELQYAVTLAIVELAAPGMDEQTTKNHAAVCTEAMQLLEKGRKAVPPIADVRRIVKLFTSLYEFWNLEDERFGTDSEISSDEAKLEFDRIMKLVNKIASRGKAKATTIEEERVKILALVDEMREKEGEEKPPVKEDHTT